MEILDAFLNGFLNTFLPGIIIVLLLLIVVLIASPQAREHLRQRIEGEQTDSTDEKEE